jgi:hypothetical protein
MFNGTDVEGKLRKFSHRTAGLRPGFGLGSARIRRCNAKHLTATFGLHPVARRSGINAGLEDYRPTSSSRKVFSDALSWLPAEKLLRNELVPWRGRGCETSRNHFLCVLFIINNRIWHFTEMKFVSWYVVILSRSARSSRHHFWSWYWSDNPHACRSTLDLSAHVCSKTLQLVDQNYSVCDWLHKREIHSHTFHLRNWWPGFD